MPILIGIRPGGRDGFAVAALYTPTGGLPGRLVLSATMSGVRAVLDQIMGLVGEWGELNAAAIDAPLTWSGSTTGRRRADTQLHEQMPSWAPKSWFPSPNSVPGAVAVQGPALAWVLAMEAKRGSLPLHELYEVHPRASLARALRDERDAILGYRNAKLGAAARAAHVQRLVRRFGDAGLVMWETDPPDSAAGLDALVGAVTAHGIAFPTTGYVTHLLGAAEIRPVGKRLIAVLDGLP